jgi:hypothetical protein
MGIPLSTILAPVDILIQLLFLPKLAYFCAIFANDGFKNGITLTHFGMRKGAIAKVYCVFYLLFGLFSIALIPFFVKELLATDAIKLREALLFAVPIPEIGFIFIGLALFIFLIREFLIHYRHKKTRPNDSALKISDSMILFILTIGIQNLLGLPQWVYVCIFAYFVYFSPFASPQEIKTAISKPSDISHLKHKSSVFE